MHIFTNSADETILGSERNVLVEALWERLNPDKWPLQVDELPNGSALVGGAVRDALLDRLSEKPDLDLVVPNNAIELTQTFAKKFQARCVVLDSERDMARLIINGWTIDFARQIGVSLESDLLRRDFRINWPQWRWQEYFIAML